MGRGTRVNGMAMPSGLSGAHKQLACCPDCLTVTGTGLSKDSALWSVFSTRLRSCSFKSLWFGSREQHEINVFGLGKINWAKQ